MDLAPLVWQILNQLLPSYEKVTMNSDQIFSVYLFCFKSNYQSGR